MSDDVSNSVPGGGAAKNELAALLADVHEGLAAAADEPQLLEAVMRYIGRSQPHSAFLFAVHIDENREPVEVEMVAGWLDGKVMGALPEPRPRYQTNNFELSSYWTQAPDELFMLEDPQNDLRVGERYRELSKADNTQAALLVPLYSRGTWHGLLSLSWRHPHRLTEEERFVYALLKKTLASFLADRRTQVELSAALAESTLLYSTSSKLLAAQNLEDTLSCIGALAGRSGALAATLSTLELDADGVPAFSLLQAAWMGGQLISPPVVRYDLSTFPMAELWRRNPNGPLFIADTETDPRVDATARALFQSSGARGTLMMPLHVQSRWVGLLSILWAQPHPFSEREQRIYRSLSTQAALLIENRLVIERVKTALHDNVHQRSLLQAVLASLPIGVTVIDVPSGKPLTANQMVAEMIGQSIETLLAADSFENTFVRLRPGTDTPIPTEELPMNRAMKSGQLESTDFDLMRRDGQRRTIAVRAAPIRDEHGVICRVAVLMDDITEHRRSELARTQMQEELIRFQSALLAERSTPLIPISDEILVMPLIGSMDTDRGQRMLDALLAGVSHSRAKVAIIDITGVKTVDTQAAAALTSAAQALRLLGVSPLLTGIRAEVAQTLVHLGVNLSSITTRSTLQSGITYALALTEKKSLHS